MPPVPAPVRDPFERVRLGLNRRRFAVQRSLMRERDAYHLVTSPVFILSSTRSGSTLLRSMLNTHSAICAPHELHLGRAQVTATREYAERSWQELGLQVRDMEDLLWDRALHLALVRSGKRIIVDKTPQNVLDWERIHDSWPRARYLHLRRHPAHVLASLQEGRPEVSTRAHIDNVLSYGVALDAARVALPGPTVRYEHLTTDPEGTMREVCRYLGVRYQRRMLDYRPGKNRGGLGDWSDRIRSGVVQEHRPLPDLQDVPEPLRDLTRRWGY